MQFSKTKLTGLFILSLMTITGCSEAQKDSAVETKKEALVELEKAKDKTVELAQDAKESANDMYDDAKRTASDTYKTAKDKTNDIYEASEEKAAELKAETAAKLKAACITAKKKLGKDPKDCQ